MNLEEATSKAREFLKTTGYQQVSLDYIKSLGEVWSCIFTSRSRNGSFVLLEVLVMDDRIVGFRRLKEGRRIED